MALALLALCMGVALGGYLLYGMHLEVSSLRGEVAQLREQGSAMQAALSLLQNNTSNGLERLQSTVHRLDTGVLLAVQVTSHVWPHVH